MWEGQDGRKSPGRSPGALAELPQEGINWIVGDPRDRLPADTEMDRAVSGSGDLESDLSVPDVQIVLSHFVDKERY